MSFSTNALTRHYWNGVVYDIIWNLVICPDDGFWLVPFFVAHRDAPSVEHYSAWLGYFLQKVFVNRFVALTNWLILFGTFIDTIFLFMVLYCMKKGLLTLMTFQSDSPSYPPPHRRHLARSFPVPSGITATLGWWTKESYLHTSVNQS